MQVNTFSAQASLSVPDCSLSLCHISSLNQSSPNLYSGPQSSFLVLLFLCNVTTEDASLKKVWKTEHCFPKIVSNHTSLLIICVPRRPIRALFFRLCPHSSFAPPCPPSSPPVCLLTDSSPSTLLRAIKCCHGYRGERVEKCALVTGQRGSQVDALTKLEEDTEKEKKRKVKTK